MNNIDHDLYHLMELRFGRDFVSSSDYRAVTQKFDDCISRVDASVGRKLHDTLYDTVMEYLTLAEYKAFRWGLRLGLQLHAL